MSLNESTSKTLWKKEVLLKVVSC